MEYILQNNKENNLLMKELIVRGYMKIYDTYFDCFDSETDDVYETVYRSVMRSIAEFYSEFFIDYHLYNEEVAEAICSCLVNEYQNKKLAKYLLGRITEEENDMLDMIREEGSIKNILEVLNEDYNLFKVLFKDFLESTEIYKRNKGIAKKFKNEQ